MIVFLVSGELTWLGELRSSDHNFFSKISRIKDKLTPKSLCTGVSKTLCTGVYKTLLSFVEEVFSYEFSEKPNYDKLKHLLKQVILDVNICPDQKYDWSKFKIPKTPLLDQNVESMHENVVESSEVGL
jgi:hypothetical protein